MFYQILARKPINILYELMMWKLRGNRYTILLGLDGSASIGNAQESFKIFDEDDNLISEGGDLEGIAHEYFHEDDN